MLNLIPQDQLNAEQKRNIHMLRYDGSDRYTVYCESKNTYDFIQKDFNCFDEVLYEIKSQYTELIKENPSLITVFAEDDQLNIEFHIYDNLENEDFTISLADLNHYSLSIKILNAKKPARKIAEETVNVN